MKELNVRDLMQRPGRPKTGTQKLKLSTTLYPLSHSVLNFLKNRIAKASKSEAIDHLSKMYINSLSIGELTEYVKEQVNSEECFTMFPNTSDEKEIPIETYIEDQFGDRSNVDIVETIAQKKFKNVSPVGVIA